MTDGGPYPAVNPNDLGEEVTISVDLLLLPYLRGVIDAEPTNPANFNGDPEDIIGTVYAFEELIKRLGAV